MREQGGVDVKSVTRVGRLQKFDAGASRLADEWGRWYDNMMKGLETASTLQGSSELNFM